MKTVFRLGAVVALATIVTGQAPKGNPASARPAPPAVTHIGDHRLGETFNEWLMIEKIDLVGACEDHAQIFTAAPSPPEPELASADSADFYKSIAAQGAWATDKLNKEQAAMIKNMSERLRHSEAVALCNDLRSIGDTGSGDYSDRRTHYVDRWTFMTGKLAGKQSVYSIEILDKELGFLKAAYGLPASTIKLPQQNAFGAKWDDILMTWHLPDGATLYVKALGGPGDDLIITFVSREYLNRSVSKEPNPYLPTPAH